MMATSTRVGISALLKAWELAVFTLEDLAEVLLVGCLWVLVVLTTAEDLFLSLAEVFGEPVPYCFKRWGAEMTSLLISLMVLSVS